LMIPVAYISRVSYFLFSYTPSPPHSYTLSLHDALPIYAAGYGPDRAQRGVRGAGTRRHQGVGPGRRRLRPAQRARLGHLARPPRSEEHTSELQSHLNLVCRLLLEKKKKMNNITTHQ